MDKLVLGDGFTEGVTQGPLVNRAQFNKVDDRVDDRRWTIDDKRYTIDNSR